MTVAFHPHHLGLSAQTPNAARLPGAHAVSEITGSESFVHLDYEGVRWVMLAHGIHDIEPDTDIEVFLDPRI
jgi:glycerol transport system ATP-binding protein